MLYKKINQKKLSQFDVKYVADGEEKYYQFPCYSFDSIIYDVHYHILKTGIKQVQKKHYWVLNLEINDPFSKHDDLIWVLRQLGFDCFLVKKHALEMEEEQVDVLYQPKPILISKELMIGWKAYKVFQNQEQCQAFLSSHHELMTPLFNRYHHHGFGERQYERCCLFQQVRNFVHWAVNVFVVIYLLLVLFSKQATLEQMGYLIPGVIFMIVLLFNGHMILENHKERRLKQFYFSFTPTPALVRNTIPDLPADVV